MSDRSIGTITNPLFKSIQNKADDKTLTKEYEGLKATFRQQRLHKSKDVAVNKPDKKTLGRFGKI